MHVSYFLIFIVNIFVSLIFSKNTINIHNHEFIKTDNDSVYDSKYEVSNNQFADYLNSAYKKNKIRLDSLSRVIGYYEGDVYYKSGEKIFYEINELSDIQFKEDSFYILQDKENFPVVKVSWFGAHIYCKYYGFELPSEMIWMNLAKNHIVLNRSQKKQSTSFVQDSTLSGIYNLNSNVSEWNKSTYDDTRFLFYRQIRGSSFKKQLEFFGKKLGNYSTQRLDDVGFRPTYKRK